MYINKLEGLIWILLLLQLTSLFGFNGLIVAAVIVLYYSFLHIKTITGGEYLSKGLVLSIIVIGIINVVYSKFVYAQSMKDGIIGIYFLGLYFSYFIFMQYFECEQERIDKLNELIMTVAAVVSLLSILQSIFYPNINLFEYSFRNGRMRIYGTAMSFFAEILGIAYWMTGRATLKMKISFVILIAALFYVSQSRSGIILLFVAIVFLVFKRLLERKSKSAFFLMIGFAVALAVSIVLLSRTILWNQIFSFVDEIDEGRGSGAARIGEIQYYWKQLQGKKAFGLGLLRGGSNLANKIYRTDLYYYIEDIGLLGFIFQTGYMGLVWVIYVIAEIIRKISRLATATNQNAETIRMTLIMFLVVTVVGITNANYIAARSTIFFFCLLLAEVDTVLLDANCESYNGEYYGDKFYNSAL